MDLVLFTQSLTEEETRQFFTKLWRLWAKQTERYTMGDSTSVPAETARELLASICYTLQLEMAQSGLTARDLLEADLHDLLKKGQARLIAKVAEAKGLWESACKQGEATESLKWIGCFFRRYDLYFFAHQTPWDMGYPLQPEISEPLKGISYVEAYLKRRLENGRC